MHVEGRDERERQYKRRMSEWEKKKKNTVAIENQTCNVT